MLGMFGIRIMLENQLLNGYANGITPNNSLCEGDFAYKNITDENEPKRKGTD